jgi:hypothetical protein
MFKSIAMTVVMAALGSAGGKSALACGGGGCGNSAACSTQTASAATAQGGGTRLYDYEPGNRAYAPAYGRPSMMGGSQSPSFGVRSADAKPLGRLP